LNILALNWILKVWYSPIKAFKEITQKPDFLGPLIILIVTSLIAAGFQQVAQSKIFVESLVPENEEWTSSTKFWTSNGALSNNTKDALMGNQSIQSFVENASRIWMKFDISKADQTLNCSEKEITKLYFSLKWNHSRNLAPANAKIQLLSSNETSFFELNITKLLQEGSIWSNITLNVNEGNSWLKQGAPTWEKITSIKFELNWTAFNPGNLTLLVDDLAFGGKFKPWTTYMFYLDNFLYSVSNFLIFWAAYFAVLLVFLKTFVFELEMSGKALFAIIGYTFSVEILQNLVSLLLASTFPTIYVGYAFTLQNAISQNWAPLLTYQIISIFYVVIMVWVIHLTAIALRHLHKFSWLKALGISAIAYIAAIFLRALIALLVGI
jgi:hypothetical protein